MLADTEPLHHQAWNKTLKPYNFQFSWEDYLAQCVGIADRVLAEQLDLPGNPHELVARKQTTFREAILATPPIPPATLALIRELSAQHRLAVVSSSAITEVEPPLEIVGLRSCFEFLITCEDVSRVKPDPEPYLLAARRIGASRPLVIEDSNSGVASAQAAGLEVVRVTGASTMAAELRAFLNNRSHERVR